MTRQGGSSSQRAYHDLKRLIVTCELPPGAEVRESAVSELLGLGRTPVREALGRLVHDGLVQVRARQGYRVTPISLDDVHQVFEMRLILEPAAVELAVQRTGAEELARLHDLAHSAQRAAPESTDQYLSDHLAFHVALARQSGNPRLADAVSELLTEMERMLRLSLARQPVPPHVDEHHELFEALASGDAMRSRAAVVRQIEQSRERVIEALVARLREAGTAPGDVLIAAWSGSQPRIL